MRTINYTIRTALVLTICAFVFSACTDTYEKDIATSNVQTRKLILTPEEYVSIAYDNPQELSEKDIIEVINDFQSIASQFKGEATTKGTNAIQANTISKYYLTNNNTIDRRNITHSIDNSKLNIPIYEVELSKNGNQKDFAIVCGDERAPKVLFYANDYETSSNEDNVGMRYLMEIAKLSSIEDIESIEEIKLLKRDSTLNKVSKELNIPKDQITRDFIKTKITTNENVTTREHNPIGGTTTPSGRILSIIPSMSNIAWHQEAPYNKQIPKGLRADGVGSYYEDNYPVGCANIAIASLFSILQPIMVGVTSNGREILIDWDYITSSRSLNSSSPAKMAEMASSLLRTIYNRTFSDPKYAVIKTYDEDNNPINIKVVTETTTTIQNMINYIKVVATYSGGTNAKFNPNTVLNSLLDQKPVLLFGNGHFVDKNHQPIDDPIYDSTPGHGWLIDGYCLAKKSGQARNDQYWSVNMGWGKNSSYIYFKTQDNFQDCDVTFPYNDEGVNITYYTQEQCMIYNIVKR